VAVLLHGLVKEAAVPEPEIDLAIGRKEAFTRNPERHTFRGWMPHGETGEAG
ncbi:MAG: type II toxin-antitoxin system RelE/ParE family toxin, partial [Gemmatimonadetes bacterium]|nr:type II toxin-antitoxin system RelE/ParE family toxin [Gemmatimonadota bacterium]